MTLIITVYGHLPWLHPEFLTAPVRCADTCLWSHDYAGKLRTYRDSRSGFREPPPPELVAEYAPYVGTLWRVSNFGRESAGEDWLRLESL